jgi:hypothetical protein
MQAWNRVFAYEVFRIEGQEKAMQKPTLLRYKIQTVYDMRFVYDCSLRSIADQLIFVFHALIMIDGICQFRMGNTKGKLESYSYESCN